MTSYQFTGRWLLEPKVDVTRTGEPGCDAGIYYGVVMGKKGRIAGDLGALVSPRSGIRGFESAEVAQDIKAAAAAELGGTAAVEAAPHDWEPHRESRLYEESTGEAQVASETDEPWDYETTLEGFRAGALEVWSAVGSQL